MVFLTNYVCVSDTVFMDNLDVKETDGEKHIWDLHKNAACL